MTSTQFAQEIGKEVATRMVNDFEFIGYDGFGDIVERYVSEAIANRDLPNAEAVVKQKEPKPKRKSTNPYNNFMKITMEEIRDQYPPKERMGEIGRRWRALSKEEQQTYAFTQNED